VSRTCALLVSTAARLQSTAVGISERASSIKIIKVKVMNKNQLKWEGLRGSMRKREDCE